MNEKTNKNWASCVDWSKHDAEIARELSLSRERIRQVRKSLGKPSSRTIKKPYRFEINLKDENWSLTNSEIAKKHDLTPWTVNKQRRIFAPETKRVSYKIVLQNIDWTKKFKEINQEIQEKYGKTIKGQTLSKYKALYAPELVTKRPRRHLAELAALINNETQNH